MFKGLITPEMHYDDWAAGYDNDVKGWGYCAPDKVIEKSYEALRQHPITPRVLDVGIGTGMVSRMVKDIRPDARISGIDISDKMLALCREKSVAEHLARLDVSTEVFPYASESFDFVMAAGVMENIENAGNALQEMGRVLKPGGLLALTYVPSARSPVREVLTKNLRTGRTNEGRLVMGKLNLFSHSALKIKVYASAMGIKPVAVENFVGYRTYVFLTVRYDVFAGRKAF